MPRNSSGVYTLPAGNPVVTATTITSAWANATMPDLGSEMTNSLDRSGRGGMLAFLRGVDGTVSVPAFSFTNEPTTGFWRSGAGVLNVTVGGSSVGSFQSGGWEGNVVAGAISTTSLNAVTGVFTGNTSANQVAGNGFVITTASNGITWPDGGGVQRTMLALQSATFNVGDIANAIASSGVGYYAGALHQWIVNGVPVLDIVAGGMVPVTTNTFALGSGGARWSNVSSVLANLTGLATLGGGLTFDGVNTLANFVDTTAFVPAITLGGGAVGVGYGGSTSGKYTRNGKSVTFSLIVSLTSKGSSTGVLLITGLPIAANAGENFFVSVTIANSTSSITLPLGAFVTAGAATIAIGTFQTNSSFTQLTNGDIQNTTSFSVSGSYITV